MILQKFLLDLIHLKKSFLLENGKEKVPIKLNLKKIEFQANGIY